MIVMTTAIGARYRDVDEELGVQFLDASPTTERHRADLESVRRRRVSVYVDESKPRSRQPWLYIAAIMLRQNRALDLITGLRADRQRIGYYGEMRFADITRAEEAQLAKAWLTRVMYPDDRAHFAVVGIDTHELVSERFGSTRRDRQHNIYVRFLRAGLAGGLKHCFGQNVEVGTVFHDQESQLESRATEVDWRTVWMLERDYGISMARDALIYVDSDHRQEPSFPGASEILQLADLVVGATRMCMEGPNRKQYQVSVAEHILPLVERLTDEKRIRNRNSRYGYVRRCSIRFFPRPGLTADEVDDPIERARSGFYVSRTPALSRRDQQSLFDLP